MKLMKKNSNTRRNIQTSADAKNIFATVCFMELESNFVNPKSSKIGRCGCDLVTRKLPRNVQQNLN